MTKPQFVKDIEKEVGRVFPFVTNPHETQRLFFVRNGSHWDRDAVTIGPFAFRRDAETVSNALNNRFRTAFAVTEK